MDIYNPIRRRHGNVATRGYPATFGSRCAYAFSRHDCHLYCPDWLCRATTLRGIAVVDLKEEYLAGVLQVGVAVSTLRRINDVEL